MNQTYADNQLVRIREQAALYMCACPAQVCASVVSMRKLFEYQMRCLDATDTDRAVHERIATAATLAHAELERCLTDILHLEGWDMETLEMPPQLQKRLLDSIDKCDV